MVQAAVPTYRSTDQREAVAQVIVHKASVPSDLEVVDEAAKGVHIEDDPEAVVQVVAHNIKGVEPTVTIANTITVPDENTPVADEPIDLHDAVVNF